MNKLPDIVICSAAAVRRTMRLSRLLLRKPFGTVLSIENPGFSSVQNKYPREKDYVKRGYAPRLTDKPGLYQHIIAFHDTHASHAFHPAKQRDLDRIIQVADDHIRHRSHRRMLIHCSMGISRSPAAALAVMAQFHRARDIMCEPAKMVEKLLAIRPRAAPDAELVRLTDQHFGFNGKLLAAVELNSRIRDNLARHHLRAAPTRAL